MNIALIGAPGAGKSKLATTLVARKGTHFEDYTVLDGYIEKFENRTNIALGFLAGAIPNLMCATERLAVQFELENLYGPDNLISCGTIVESMGYMSMHLVDAAKTDSRPDLARERADVFMQILGGFFETWSFDYVFYLPLPSEEEPSLKQRLDHSIRDALSYLSLDHVILNGSNVENYQTVVDTVYGSTQTEE